MSILGELGDEKGLISESNMVVKVRCSARLREKMKKNHGYCEF